MASAATIRARVRRAWVDADVAALEVPRPRRQCDGIWLTPLWCVDTGKWELSMMEETGEEITLIPRAKCLHPGECDALHEEDFTADQLLKIKGRQSRRQARDRKAS